uniref:Pregnane X receptor variant 3 n=1 Tax=Solea senegalensis TaxID=28829 RepID=A0A2P1DNR4_SOLSE|nr:pregnane X receptor variant 3 [Solea senegalensis]
MKSSPRRTRRKTRLTMTSPEKHLLFPKVVACLTEMRTMTEEYCKQVLQIQDIQPDDISPLILEVVSKDSCNDF